MTRYLHHLVARSRGHLDVIRPRVPSRFEPWSDQLEPSATWTVEPAPPAQASVPEAQTDGPTASRAPTRQNASTNIRERQFIAHPTATQPAAPPVATQIGSPAASPAFHRAVAEPSAMSSDASARASVRAAPVQVSLDPATSLALHGTPNNGAATIGVLDHAATRAAAAPHLAASEEPVVHVTIGRIDVRAVGAPVASPPRQRTSPPARRLEDWLSGRSR